jgi:hypothetical protein
MRIGITGHQTLRCLHGWEWVDSAVRQILAEWCPGCVGITSLAAGADQRFAKVVLEVGGTLEVIVPFPGYESRFEREEDRSTYQRLLGAARAVLTLPRSADDDQACYLAAGQRVVDRSHALVAVWDGEPAAGVGGTADIVVYAASRGKKVVHVNPIDESVTTLTLVPS